MKILFLDVDGVLNNKAVLSEGNSCWMIDNNCLLLLKEIVEKTDCQIVLSSTWRCFETGKSALKQHFRKKGIPQWISQTPDINLSARKDEILKWLMDNNIDQINDKIAILDDDIEACLVPKWFFMTFFDEGLTREIADDVIDFLNKDC